MQQNHHVELMRFSLEPANDPPPSPPRGMMSGFHLSSMVLTRGGGGGLAIKSTMVVTLRNHSRNSQSALS